MASPLASALGITLADDQAKLKAEAEAAAKANLPTIIVQADSLTGQKVEDDAELARNTLHAMIEKNNTAIDQLLDISRESMQPRAYEVLAQLIRHNADISEKLLKIHNDKTIVANNTINLARNRNNFTGANTGPGGTTSGNTFVSINNAVFTGTTAELLEMIRTAAPNQLLDQSVPDDDDDVDLPNQVDEDGE
jgi:hypothetical protein